jgi:hypothetical protein
MVSWDADNGKLASFESENRAVFARRGWGRFMDDLVGYEVPRYSDCGQPEKTTQPNITPRSAICLSRSARSSG